MKILRPYSLWKRTKSSRGLQKELLSLHLFTVLCIVLCLMHFKPEVLAAEEAAFPSQENIRTKPWFSTDLKNSSLFVFGTLLLAMARFNRLTDYYFFFSVQFLSFLKLFLATIAKILKGLLLCPFDGVV